MYIIGIRELGVKLNLKFRPFYCGGGGVYFCFMLWTCDLIFNFWICLVIEDGTGMVESRAPKSPIYDNYGDYLPGLKGFNPCSFTLDCKIFGLCIATFIW